MRRIGAYRAMTEALGAEQGSGRAPTTHGRHTTGYSGGRGMCRAASCRRSSSCTPTSTDVSTCDPLADPAAWDLLLQVEADHRLGGSFGDGGTLFFGVPSADLAAGDFGRVQAISQSE